MQGGEDRIELTLGVFWNPKRMLSWPFIEKAKVAAQEAGTAQLVEFQGLGFVVERRGRAGFCWVVTYGGITFYLNRQQFAEGNYGNARAEIGSMALMQYGPEKCMQVVRVFLKKLGGELQWDNLTRIDPCIDAPADIGAELIQGYLDGHRVCRATKFAVYYVDEGRKARATGIMIGRGDVTCRIYDKVRELEDHTVGASEKRDWLAEFRWGGEVPSRAWRVEFQVRSKPLRELGVTTFADWMQKRGEVLAYLCREWLRFTEEPPTRGNQRRTSNSALWEEISAAFASWCGRVTDRVKRAYRAITAKVDLDRRAKAAVSSLIGVAVEELGGKGDPWEIGDPVVKIVEYLLRTRDFGDAWLKAHKKMAKRGFTHPRFFNHLQLVADLGCYDRNFVPHWEEDDVPF